MLLSVMANNPSHFTDDLSIKVARDETLDSLVDYLLASEQVGTLWLDRLSVLTERFALSFDDARLAVDRVHGGRARAGNPANQPDRTKDPIAWIAYRRALGEPVVRVTSASEAWRELLDDATKGDSSNARNRVDTTSFQAAARTEEKAAAGLWRDAYDSVGRSQGTREAQTALRLHDLGAATMASSCPAATKARVLLQVATAISTATEADITELGEETCAREGSQTWVDAVRLADASRRVAISFAELGEADLERRAYDLRGRIVTRTLGQCPARVGSAMLDSARCSLRSRDSAGAAAFCEPVIADFKRVVDEWESNGATPYDEHRIALQHLRSAIDLLASVRVVDAAVATLRRRCEALLARQD